MKKLLLLVFTFFFLAIQTVFANDASSIQKGIDYLRSKQDDSGKITTGFSSPSQWRAIAFEANGIDPTTIKNSQTSIYDFLLQDTPTNDTPTDWENRILAIVAIQGNPTNFNGTNYVSHLESFYNNNQIGDTCSLNDDIFGLLALVASGESANAQIKQDTLSFLISKQDPTDGGFGFSAPGCAWYSSSADMTGAGVQALVAARDHNITVPGLDDAITKAKNYLLTNQNADGGYGYFGSSDTDTTGWVLMGLNSLGLESSDQATKAKSYLLSQQSPIDGGIMAFDWSSHTSVSNATTTAQALIALSGKIWVLHIYSPDLKSTPSSSATPSAVPTPTNTPALTFTPTPTLTSIDQQTNIYKTITITTTPSLQKSEKTNIHISSSSVLGDNNEKTHPTNQNTPIQPNKTVTVLGTRTKNLGYLFTALACGILAVFFEIKVIKRKRFDNN